MSNKIKKPDVNTLARISPGTAAGAITGGVTGAVLGGLLFGPVGAVCGFILLGAPATYAGAKLDERNRR